MLSLIQKSSPFQFLRSDGCQAAGWTGFLGWVPARQATPLRFRVFMGLLLMLTLPACQPTESSHPNAMFKLLSAAESGISFTNTVPQTDSLNLLKFEYMYNGGGVGVGDFNGDGLPDLVFTGNLVASSIYLNLGDLKFRALDPDAGFSTEGKWCTGVTVTDINQDGLDDVYVCVGGPGNRSVHPNLLFVNQGDGHFKEMADAYGLADSSESNHAVFFDYDLDGDLDLYLLNGGGFERSAVTIKPILANGSARNTDKLYENTGVGSGAHPVFRDVSARAGIQFEGFGLGVSVIDANRDGWPDLYVSNDYLSRDLLYVNNQDGTFREEAGQYFNHTSHFSMGNSVADIDNDGYFDLVTLDMLPQDHFRRMTMFGPNQYDRFHQAVGYGYGHQYMRNMLQLGTAEGPFREIGQLAGIDRTDWSWSPLVADFDNDGLQDLYITNGYGKNITDLDFVKFRQGAVDPFSSPEDVNAILSKSLEDLAPIVLPNFAFRQRGEVVFENNADDWGMNQPSISNGAAYADLDQDGDLEIIVNNINQAAFLYQNMRREHQPDSSMYLRVKLNGPAPNLSGIGALVTANIGGLQLQRYQQPVTGFQSSVSNLIHFGIGGNSVIDSLEVIWPDGHKQKLFSLSANQSISIDYQPEDYPPTSLSPSAARLPLLAKQSSIGQVQDEVGSSSEFKTQPLLHQGYSNQGPGLAVADVNGDGRDDFFVGGPYGSSATLFFQGPDGSFSEQTLPTEAYEDLGAVFLDADGDGDEDLYLASGGSERYAGHIHYQDRLYLNNGKGLFERDSSALPEFFTSTSTVASADFDGDGRLDLFVGGRVVPGQFPGAPSSYLLKNTGGKFADVTDQICPALSELGMVTSGIWTDFDNDNRLDLIVVGEFMNITAFKNVDGKLIEITDPLGLGQTAGMWNSITSGDFDHDGDLDYVVGNIGLNNPYRASPSTPLMLHYGDFTGTGSVDPIFSMYEQEAYYPLASFDLLTERMPLLKKHFLLYAEYAQATTQDILDKLDTREMKALRCQWLESVILENIDGKKMVVRPLPRIAQLAPTKGILVEDINEDGLLDILLVGNDYQREVTFGRMDASYGTVLLQQEDWKFTPLPSSQSGVFTSGDTRAIATLALANKKAGQMILISKNKGRLASYEQSPTASYRMRFEHDESFAIVELPDRKKRKIEYLRGGNYLSQSSKSFLVPGAAHAIQFFLASGESTRTIKFPTQSNNQ